MAESRAETQSRREVAPSAKRLANSTKQFLANRGRNPTMQWQKTRLGSILRFSHGKAIKPLASGKFKVYGSNGVIGYASKSLYRNAIILGRVGAYCGSVAREKNDFWASDNTIVCDGIEGTSSVDFCYYLLKHLKLNDYAGGAAQPLITQGGISRIPTSLPPLPTQRAIAEKLGRYDDLIENNRRRIAILERKAEQLYKEWFVRRRFPGHEKAKWIGGLPEGWRVEKIKNVVQRLPFGRTYKEKELSSEGKVIVVDQSTKQWLGFHDDAPSHFANAEKPIILFGDHSCKFQLMTQDFSLGENVIPFIAEKKLNTYYLYYSVHRLICTEEYKRHWGRLSAMKILIPSLDKQNSFANIVAKHAALILNLQRQNALLAKERDLLLPRLMSGRVKP